MRRMTSDRNQTSPSLFAARTCVAVSALPVRVRMKLDTVAIRRR